MVGLAIATARCNVTVATDVSGAVSKETVGTGAMQSTPVVIAPLDADLSEVAASLAPAPVPVLALYGGVAPRPAVAALGQDLAITVATAAERTGAIVLDGTGCLAHGGALSDKSRMRQTVVRVTSRRCAAVDTSGGDYTHVVLLDSDGDAEHADLLLALGRRLALSMPLVLVVLGGDDAALAQAAAALERGIQVFVAIESGRRAHHVAAAHPRLALVDPRANATLASRLAWALHTDLVLKDAWRLFRTFDREAVQRRSRFERFQATILLLGVLATLLALISNELGTGTLRWAVVAASVALAGATALSGRRASGKRWILTRAAAESVKSEIFRYRTGTGRYADRSCQAKEPLRCSEALAARLGMIERRLVHTEVGNSPLPVAEGLEPPFAESSGDDGLRPIGAEDYIELRVNDQLRYYRNRLRDYDRRLRLLQGVAIVASSAGALVAALGGQIWVALTSAMAAAPLAYLAHLQVAKTIVTYNQSVAQLDDVLRRWHARAPRAPTRPALARLVDATEAILTAEHGTWVEEMTEAMQTLDEPGEGAEPGEKPR